METNESIREKLTLKGWKTSDGSTQEIENKQRESYWYSNDPKKLTIHLQLKEVLTETSTPPKLFIYTQETGWRELTIDDIP